jgi:hypothetical protein
MKPIKDEADHSRADRAIKHMQPSTNNFTEPSGGGTMEAADRRRAPRVPHRAAFDICPLGGRGMGEAVTVILQDLSATGIGIIHSDGLCVGDQYQIPLTRELAGPMSLIATVVRCEQLDDGLYNIGFQFKSSAAAVDEGSRQLTGHPAPRD